MQLFVKLMECPHVLAHHIADGLRFKHFHFLAVPQNLLQKIVRRTQEIFENANWYEREIYEMYNINFIGHNNLKKLFNEI